MDVTHNVPAAAAQDTAHDQGTDFLLRTRDLSFRYPNGTQAIQSLDLRIGRGEVVAILGPSGCGKSTLLSLIAGLAAPQAGSVEWNEAIVGPPQTPRSRPARRRLSVVFQQDTLLPWKTVEQNVEFGLRYLEISKRERQERVERLLAMGKITDFRHAHPRELSGGMKRRTAFLAGIVTLPHLLLLDEPFSALDEPTRVGLHGDALAMIYELGLSVVLVTHDISEAISLADRVYVLSQRPGTVAWSESTNLGRPRDVLAIRTSEDYTSVYNATWRELWDVIKGQGQQATSAGPAPLAPPPSSIGLGPSPIPDPHDFNF